MLQNSKHALCTYSENILAYTCTSIIKTKVSICKCAVVSNNLIGQFNNLIGAVCLWFRFLLLMQIMVLRWADLHEYFTCGFQFFYSKKNYWLDMNDNGNEKKNKWMKFCKLKKCSQKINWNFCAINIQAFLLISSNFLKGKAFGKLNFQKDFLNLEPRT